MYVARSFDVNRPGLRPSKLKGGIVGGSIVEGSFSVGDSILIAPEEGLLKAVRQDGNHLKTVIENIQAGGLDLEAALCRRTLWDSHISRPDVDKGGRPLWTGDGQGW